MEQVTGKKAVRLRAWSGPECSRELSFPDFMIKAQDGANFGSLTHQQTFPPGKAAGTHFC